MSRGYKQITGKDGRPFVKGDKRINRRGRPPVLPNLEMLLAKTLGAEINNCKRELTMYKKWQIRMYEK